MKPYAKAGTMTGKEFQHLRKELGLSVTQCAYLLGCKEQTIRNIEGGSTQQPGRQMAILLRLLCYPDVRMLITRLHVNYPEKILESFP